MGDPVRAITAAVCTYGDAPHLFRALGSLVEQRLPEGLTLETLCVDNNPQPKVALPAPLACKVRVIREPAAGLSRARNKAIAEACGDTVAFLDDDAVALPEWTAALAQSFERTGAWCVGGRILPEWPEGEPSWLPPQLRSLLSLVDLGSETLVLRGPVFPCGVNMAVRRFALDRVGTFRASLGRRPGSLLSGEEIDLFRRVLRAGGEVAYTPDAVVRHIIPASRLSPKYLRSRAWWEGKSLALIDRLNEGRPYAAAIALARAGLALIREPFAYVAGGRELAICRARKAAGYWAGLFTPIED